MTCLRAHSRRPCTGTWSVQVRASAFSAQRLFPDGQSETAAVGPGQTFSNISFQARSHMAGLKQMTTVANEHSRTWPLPQPSQLSACKWCLLPTQGLPDLTVCPVPLQEWMLQPLRVEWLTDASFAGVGGVFPRAGPGQASCPFLPRRLSLRGHRKDPLPSE